MELLLTVSEASRALGIGKTRLYEMLRSGELPSVQVGRRSRRIPVRALEDWIEQMLAEQGAVTTYAGSREAASERRLTK